MLTARSVIIAVFTIAVLSILGAVLELMQPLDKGGLARDSYGTRPYGQRALYELLEKLNVPVERSFTPPSAPLHRDICLVLLSPDPGIVNLEPEHLHRVAGWVREGGVVVVAPGEDGPSRRAPGSTAPEPLFPPREILEALGLDGVVLADADTAGDEGETDTQSRQNASNADESAGWSWRSSGIRPPLLRRVSVGADGELADLERLVRSLGIPLTGFRVIDDASTAGAAGRVFFRFREDGFPHTVVGLYRVGNGSVIVFSDPDLLVNFAVAEADNPVLAAHILARFGRPVVFDEFYHGLTTRGNPFWLLTRWPYGLVAVLLVLAAVLWIWREAVHLGPPLPERLTQRRTIGEYVEAMANAFHRADCRVFVLREVRDGVLWALRKKLFLPPRCEEVEDVARVIARRKPDEAKRLVSAVVQLNAVLDEGERPRERNVVRAAGEVTECL